jgi:triacylglycerol esterase/lipase EstA (alpha/beta hydrolase family)
MGWSLVQPILSSSYLGFGHGSLSRDTDEIVRLMEYLVCHHSAERFALVGHSTGCQNSIHLLKHGRKDLVNRVKVSGASPYRSGLIGRYQTHDS